MSLHICSSFHIFEKWGTIMNEFETKEQTWDSFDRTSFRWPFDNILLNIWQFCHSFHEKLSTDYSVAKIWSNVLDVLKHRCVLLYMWANFPRPRSGSKVSTNPVNPNCEFHVALYVTQMLQLSSPARPCSRQRGGDNASATDLLSCCLHSNIGQHSPFCPISLRKVFWEK